MERHEHETTTRYIRYTSFVRIATVALRKTAEMGRHKYRKATKVNEENTYMDEVIESVTDKEQAKNLTQDIENLRRKF